MSGGGDGGKKRVDGPGTGWYQDMATAWFLGAVCGAVVLGSVGFAVGFLIGGCVR